MNKRQRYKFPIITDWKDESSRFTSNNFGTTTIRFKTRRVGDSLQIQGNWTAGTTAAGTASFTLPSGYRIDTGKLGGAQVLSTYTRIGTGTQPADLGMTFYDGSTDNEIFLTISYSGNALTKTNASSLSASGQIDDIGIITIPIAGWKANK